MFQHPGVRHSCLNAISPLEIEERWQYTELYKPFMKASKWRCSHSATVFETFRHSGLQQKMLGWHISIGSRGVEVPYCSLEYSYSWKLLRCDLWATLPMIHSAYHISTETVTTVTLQFANAQKSIKKISRCLNAISASDKSHPIHIPVIVTCQNPYPNSTHVPLLPSPIICRACQSYTTLIC